jgi:hypothetical protein
VHASPAESTRATALAAIPRYYSPYAHLGATTAVGVATLVAAALAIHHVTALEMVTAPIALVLSNAFEWRAHKGVLHRRRWPLHVLYDRHTPIHHKIYQYDSMAVRSAKELRLVLIPATGVAAVVVVAAPFAYLLGHFVSPNCGWLAIATSAAYVVTYELSHLSYHLPDDSLIGRLGLVRVLREHHRRHHHPALMMRWNFNVTLPLFHLLHRTIAPAALVEDTVAASREQRDDRSS